MNANKDIQEYISSMAKTMSDHGWRFTNFISDGSNVSVIFASRDKIKSEDFQEHDFNRLLDKQILPVVKILSDPLVASDPEPLHNTAMTIQKASMILSSIAAVLGMYVLYTLRAVEYWYIDLKNLFLSMAFVGLGAVFFYVSYILKNFRGHSRIYNLLILPTVAIFFTGFLSLYVFTRYTNVYLDKSQPKYALCTIKNKDTKHRRRASDKYVLTLTHPFYFGELLDINVPSKFYRSIEVNDQIQIGVNGGYWGFEWISSISSTPSATAYTPKKIRSNEIF